MFYISAALFFFALAVYFYIHRSSALAKKFGVREEPKVVKYNPEIEYLGRFNYFVKLSDYAGKNGTYASAPHLGFVSLVMFALVFVLSLIVLRSLTLALVAGAIAFVAAPRLYAGLLIQKQRDKISDQITGAILAITSALRAGKTLPDAIGAAVDLPAPLGPELGKVYASVKHGGEDLNTALRKMLERLGNHHIIQKAVLAIVISRQTGGDVASALEKIGLMLDDENHTRDFAKSHSSHGRMVAVTFNIVMVVVALNMNRLSPGTFTNFFLSDITGQLMLFGCIGAVLLGWFFIHRILAGVYNV